MNRSADLRDRFNRMAEILPGAASAATEQRLLLAFRARRRKRVVWRSIGSAAVCVILSLAMLLTRHRGQVFESKASQNSPSLTPEGFIELPYAESGVPMEDAVIVRLRLRASDLRRLGVPVGLPTPTGRVADLLVGQDGVPRAVRLVE